MIERPMYVDKIMAYVDTPFVKILTGVRRCGYQFEAGRTAFVIKMLLVAANLGMSCRFVMLACKKLYGIPKLSCEAGT